MLGGRLQAVRRGRQPNTRTELFSRTAEQQNGRTVVVSATLLLCTVVYPLTAKLPRFRFVATVIPSQRLSGALTDDELKRLTFAP